ncbi:MAG: hypothetical protein IPN08_01605 [Bacteroidales bacterium]|nr:hypothetical protein [Bacteroidales bacterium]
MKRLTILLISLLFIISAAKAQPPGVDPFYDAVPYSVKKFNKTFLTNQDAGVVRSFFEHQVNNMPIRVIQIDQGHHHGYRFYYPNAANNPDGPEAWIQVFTVDVGKSIELFEKSNPALLEAPFLGLKAAAQKFGYPDEDVATLYNQYKQIATRYYQEVTDVNGNKVNEMTVLFQKYYSRLKQQPDQMLASGYQGPVMLPENAREYSWNLWLLCFEEIEQTGYRTIIEYSGIPETDR